MYLGDFLRSVPVRCCARWPLSGSWRISEKIAATYLSAVTYRDLSSDLASWADGVDTNHFVVIDSNVDCPKAIGYEGPTTYRARRASSTRARLQLPPQSRWRPSRRSRW